MNCTDCPNTVPITSGQVPKYVRPIIHPPINQRQDGGRQAEPLCRICWEKAVEPCAQHERIPFHNDRVLVGSSDRCVGILFTCPMCNRRVCSGYQAPSDPRCQTCVSEPEDD